MSEVNSHTVLEKSMIIRQELKEWEKQFAAANNGRKAGRAEIKKDPAIASKYKEYERLRRILSGKEPVTQATKKRKLPQQEARLPSRRDQNNHSRPNDDFQSVETPSKARHPASLDPYDTPASARKFSTPSHQRTFIGPTPQKDGHMLGLFDLLSEPTPTKNEKRTTLGGIAPNAQLSTPSKTRATKEVEVSGGGRRSRTPASTGKRYLLDTFVTPLKRRRIDDSGGGTPSSVSKLHFSTPAFLRRDSQRLTTVNEEGDLSPVMRMPKKPPIRGLSSMLAGLRKLEEEKLDEDLDILREMERGDQNVSSSVPQVLVGDSQAIVVPGVNGFESDNLYSGDEGDGQEGLGRDGKPLKVWKKKGQKRTTRRVILRPVRSRPNPLSEAPPLSDDDGDELVIPETQNDAAMAEPSSAKRATLNSKPSGLEDDSDASDHSNNSQASHQPKRRNPAEAPTAKHTSKATDVKSKDGPVKRAAKKVSAQAHANFRRLNIKNKNTKGRSGGRKGGRR